MNECYTITRFGNTANVSEVTALIYSIQQERTAEALEKLRFIAYGILSFTIIGLGIIGHLVSLVILSRPSFKGITFGYLKCLTVSDLCALVCSISTIIRLNSMQTKSYAVALYYAHVEIPLVNGFMASSVFLVIALTVDRYFSVCLPTRFKEVHNTRRAKNSMTGAYVGAFLLYLPICFQKTSTVISKTSEMEYAVCDNVDVVSHIYFKVYLFSKELLVRLGPVVLLAILNISIVVQFRKMLKKRRDLTSMPPINGELDTLQVTKNKICKEEQRFFLFLVGIAILFFICMTPASILTLLYNDDKEQDFGFQLFRAFANILELFNHSMNFYVYCLCNPDIWKTVSSFFICMKISPSARSLGNVASVKCNTNY